MFSILHSSFLAKYYLKVVLGSLWIPIIFSFLQGRENFSSKHGWEESYNSGLYLELCIQKRELRAKTKLAKAGSNTLLSFQISNYKPELPFLKTEGVKVQKLSSMFRIELLRIRQKQEQKH